MKNIYPEYKKEDSADADIADTIEMLSSQDSYGTKNLNFELLKRNNREETKDSDSLISVSPRIQVQHLPFVQFKAIKASQIDTSPTNSYGLQLRSPKNYFSNCKWILLTVNR